MYECVTFDIRICMIKIDLRGTYSLSPLYLFNDRENKDAGAARIRYAPSSACGPP